MAIAMGATDFITSDRDVRRDFRKIAGAAPDAVFECVGAEGMLDYCIGLAPIHSQRSYYGRVHAARCHQDDEQGDRYSLSMAYDVHDFQVTVDALASSSFDPTQLVTNRVDFGPMHRGAAQPHEPMQGPADPGLNGSGRHVHLDIDLQACGSDMPCTFGLEQEVI